MKRSSWPTVSTERIRLLGCHVDRQLYQVGQWVPIIIISFQAPQTVSANTNRHVFKNPSTPTFHTCSSSTDSKSRRFFFSCRTRKPVEQCRTSRTSPSSAKVRECEEKRRVDKADRGEIERKSTESTTSCLVRFLQEEGRFAWYCGWSPSKIAGSELGLEIAV